VSRVELDPSHIMQVGMGFWPSKTVLSAVELELFTRLGAESMTGEEIGDRLGLHPRAIYDFLNALVALRLLERDGDGNDGR
jgi:predicted transcriptional regulator